MALADTCVLVSINIKQWSGNVTDKKISSETARTYGVTSDKDLRVRKSAMAKESLAKINGIAARARGILRDRTVPFATSLYLARNAKLDEIETALIDCRDLWQPAVSEFVANYPALKSEQKYRLGSAFDPMDYPQDWRIEERFSLRWKKIQVPRDDDRFGFTDDDKAMIESEVKEKIGRKIRELLAGTTNKKGETATPGLIRRLSEYTGESKGRFNDSIIGNIRELTELIPDWNLYDDPKIEELRTRIVDEITGFDPQDLRDSGENRIVCADAAAKLLADMDDYL